MRRTIFLLISPCIQFNAEWGTGGDPARDPTMQLYIARSQIVDKIEKAPCIAQPLELNLIPAYSALQDPDLGYTPKIDAHFDAAGQPVKRRKRKSSLFWGNDDWKGRFKDQFGRLRGGMSAVERVDGDSLGDTADM